MSHSPLPMRALLAVLVLLASAWPLPGHAESLSKVKTAALPTLATDQPLLGVVAVEGKSLAIGADQAWMLDSGGVSWKPLDWKPAAAGGELKSVAGNGQLAFLLRGPAQSTVVASVERLGLVNGQPTATPLPPLPVVVEGARAAANADNVYVAGIDVSGQAVLLSLASTAAKPEWKKNAGWPGNALPTSLVAQTSAVFVTVSAAGGERILRWAADSGW